MTIYTCGTLSDWENTTKAFQAATGIKATILNLDCTALVARATTEHQQHVLKADEIGEVLQNMVALDSAGVLAPINSPETAGLMKSAVYQDYIGLSQSPRVVVWNTKMIKGSDVPTSYLDVLT